MPKSAVVVVDGEAFRKSPEEYLQRACRGEILYVEDVDGKGREMLIGAGLQTPTNKANLAKAISEAAEEAKLVNLDDDFDYSPFLENS